MLPRTTALACLTAILLLLPAAGVATVLHVDDDAVGAGDGSNWRDAFPLLQDALATAVAGDQVWVAQGTYQPDLGGGELPGDRSASFVLESGVEIYGGFDGTEQSLDDRAGLFDETVLTGDLAGDDPGGGGNGENSLHVVRIFVGTDATALLDGFTITGGNANLDFADSDGGGILNEGAPTLRNLRVVDNRAGEGGGMYNGRTFDDGDATLVDCEFVGNHATDTGGGFRNLFGDPVMERVTFRDNTAANHAGAFITDHAIPCSRCVFVGNAALSGWGGAVYINRTDTTFTNCIFADNSASLGGAAYLGLRGTAKFINCELVGNSAGNGGAVYGINTSPIFVGTTFSSNSASGSGGGMFHEGTSEPLVINSVLWGNSDGSGDPVQGQIAGVVLDVAWSLIQDDDPDDGDIPFGGAANHNLDDDPLFVDPDGADDVPGTEDDDLRLDPGSPAVDAADNGSLPPDITDLDGDGDTAERTPVDLAGEPRLVKLITPAPSSAPAVDMGAREVQSADPPRAGGGRP